MSEREAKLDAVAEMAAAFWRMEGLWTLHSIETLLAVRLPEHGRLRAIGRLRARKRLYDSLRQSLLDAGYEAPTAEEMGV